MIFDKIVIAKNGGKMRISRSIIKKPGGIFPQGPKKTLRNFRRYLTWKNIRKVMLYSAIIIFLFVVLLFAWFSRDLPSPNKINSRLVSQSTKIVDRGGNLLYEVHGDKRRTLIEFNQMPDNIKKATIAIEDPDFYKHGGFSFRAITRSIYYNILARRTTQGGSTITQQFTKNALLSPEQTYSRKIKEIILSTEIEWMFSKDDILKMYLNEIPYGSNAYGIEAAAQTYFGKHANELTLPEAASLAAMAQAPTYYSPYGTHTDALMARKNMVLDKMTEQGTITKEQAAEAKTVQVVFNKSPENIKAAHFVFYVKEQLIQKYGEKMVEEGGLKVTTTLDPKKQDIAQNVVSNANVEQYGGSNAALVAEDPKTGQILAMVGSKDYFNSDIDGQVNVADRERQPGSSFKPYVYATAFEKGYTPETLIYDLNTNFGGGYEPKNYDLSQHGPVTMRAALCNSLNIPAVKTLYLAGVKESIDTAHNLGITTLNEPDRYGLALVLGGGEIKLVDHVAAMSSLATEGTRHEKTSILKVEDSKGKVLEEYKDDPKQVLDVNVARAMCDVMSDNNARAMIFGTNTPLHLSRTAAAKTGTTEEFRDAWTVGFTPNLAAGVWTGNNDNTTMHQGVDGVFVAAPIWHDFMEQALADYPVEEFNKSFKLKGQTSDKAVLNGKAANKEGEKVRVCTVSNKKATDNCPAEAIQEKEYHDAHEILFYVDRTNPLGPVPSNPAADPQFNNWEAPVKAKYGGGEQAPTETCNIHVEANKPYISISSPSSGSSVNNSFSTTVTVNAPLGIKRVDVLLDGSTIIGSGYGTTVNCSTSASGNHTIQARITDQGYFTATSSQVSISIANITPSGVSATNIVGHKVQVTWHAPSGSVDGYLVERKSAGGDWSQIGPSTPDTQKIDTPPAGDTYYYRVRAYKGSSYSDYVTSGGVSVSSINFYLSSLFKTYG